MGLFECFIYIIFEWMKDEYIIKFIVFMVECMKIYLIEEGLQRKGKTPISGGKFFNVFMWGASGMVSLI